MAGLGNKILNYKGKIMPIQIKQGPIMNGESIVEKDSVVIKIYAGNEEIPGGYISGASYFTLKIEELKLLQEKIKSNDDSINDSSLEENKKGGLGYLLINGYKRHQEKKVVITADEIRNKIKDFPLPKQNNQGSSR